MKEEYEVIYKSEPKYVSNNMISLGKDIADRIDVSRLIWRENSLTVIVRGDSDSNTYEVRNSISESILDWLERPVGFNIFTDDTMSSLCAVRISDKQSTLDGYASLYTGIMNLDPEHTKSVYTELDDINQDDTNFSDRIVVISICQEVADKDISEFNVSFDVQRVRDFISKNF